MKLNWKKLQKIISEVLSQRKLQENTRILRFKKERFCKIRYEIFNINESKW